MPESMRSRQNPSRSRPLRTSYNMEALLSIDCRWLAIITQTTLSVFPSLGSTLYRVQHILQAKGAFRGRRAVHDANQLRATERAEIMELPSLAMIIYIK